MKIVIAALLLALSMVFQIAVTDVVSAHHKDGHDGGGEEGGSEEEEAAEEEAEEAAEAEEEAEAEAKEAEEELAEAEEEAAAEALKNFTPPPVNDSKRNPCKKYRMKWFMARHEDTYRAFSKVYPRTFQFVCPRFEYYLSIK